MQALTSSNGPTRMIPGRAVTMILQNMAFRCFFQGKSSRSFQERENATGIRAAENPLSTEPSSSSPWRIDCEDPQVVGLKAFPCAKGHGFGVAPSVEPAEANLWTDQSTIFVDHKHWVIQRALVHSDSEPLFTMTILNHQSLKINSNAHRAKTEVAATENGNCWGTCLHRKRQAFFRCQIRDIRILHGGTPNWSAWGSVR